MASTVFQCTILSESVAIRNGPGTNYPLSGESLSKGDIFYTDDIVYAAGDIWAKYNTNQYVCVDNDGSRYIDYQPYVAPVKTKSISSIRAGVLNTASLLASQPNQLDAVDTSASTSTDTSDSSSDSTDTNTATSASEEDIEAIYTAVLRNVTNGKNLELRNMRLFGLPYQFRPEIDKRVTKVSKYLGRKFIENIVNEAPIVTILPGVPKYIPNAKNKDGTGRAIILAANGAFDPLKQVLNDESGTIRYYDFQNSYTEYIKYVNMMCRTAAAFLQLSEETIDGVSLQQYDWRNYRWTGSSFESVSSKMFSAIASGSAAAAHGMIDTIATFGENAVSKFNSLFNASDGSDNYKIKVESTDGTDDTADTQTFDSIFQSSSFVQFYVDPNMGTGESGSNSTSESKIKGMMDSGSDASKELAFIMNSGGADVQKFQEFADTSLDQLSGLLGGGGNITTFLQRILDVGGNIIKGENIIMPEYYTNSSYERRYSLTIHLKAPYGNRFSYYIDVLVPLFHALCLALPRQTTANTYGAPFIVKALCEGVFSCNLGIVSSFSVDKNVSPEAWTVDGFPSEVDISMEISDLYSDLTISPTTNPTQFVNNTSLIEYLATTCGLNITQPQLSTRLNTIINTFKNSFTDIPHNVLQEVNQNIENFLSSWSTISGH